MNRKKLHLALQRLAPPESAFRVLLVRGDEQGGKSWTRHVVNAYARSLGHACTYVCQGLIGSVDDVLEMIFAGFGKPAPPRDSTDDSAAADDDGVPGSIQAPAALEEKPLAGVRGLLSLFRLKQTWLLMPLNVLVGAELSYNVGAFPTLLPDAGAKRARSDAAHELRVHTARGCACSATAVTP